MKLLAGIGVAFALVLLILGIFLLSSGRHGGIVVTIIGGIGLLFWLLMVPLARRRNKL
jgi:hypothetical protein